ncbi:hypothetical protein SNF32_06700 [Enterococcus mundtii]|nr:hypothetical protein [Enterococcus mundtii]
MKELVQKNHFISISNDSYYIGSRNSFSKLERVQNQSYHAKFTLGNDVQAIDINSLDLSTVEEKLNIINSLLNGTSENKFLVLEENNTIDKNKIFKHDDTNIYSNLNHIIEPVSFKPDEILIVCFKKNTTKNGIENN